MILIRTIEQKRLSRVASRGGGRPGPSLAAVSSWLPGCRTARIPASGPAVKKVREPLASCKLLTRRGSSALGRSPWAPGGGKPRGGRRRVYRSLKTEYLRPGCIRDLLVAAPLKRNTRKYTRAAAATYPRPTGRGPIEARDLVSDSGSGRKYPRPTGRGPIEACPRRAGLRATVPYPRPTGRGPIEASTCAGLTCASWCIRDLLVAAPLKHDLSPADLDRLRRVSATYWSRPH